MEITEQNGQDWLIKKLPPFEKLHEAYAKARNLPITKASMEGDCHTVATILAKMLNKKRVKAIVKRGHWHGPDVRPERANFPFQQHSWTEITTPTNKKVYADPTQFVFTGEAPNIAVTTTNDNRYDPSGYRLRQMVYSTRPFPERNGKTKPSKLSLKARKSLEQTCADRDWSRWTTEEMARIANTSPEILGDSTKEILQTIIKSGQGALIPFDTRTELFGPSN